MQLTHAWGLERDPASLRPCFCKSPASPAVYTRFTLTWQVLYHESVF